MNLIATMNLLAAVLYTAGATGLAGVLIHLLILLLILSLIYYIVTLLPLPPVFLRIAQIIFAIVVILYLASMLGGCTPGAGISASYTDQNGNSYSAGYHSAGEPGLGK